ncbi:MAG: helix-turn-helix domain-containing protein [Peptococcaceae bacterium]|nr:helix-turn-helix domain-containing protein [Peptococcaceae bacterium]
MNDIGARLKYFRKKKGLSLRALGRASNTSHSFIADIEAGRSKPSIDTLTALAKALGVSLADLTCDDPNEAAAKTIENAISDDTELLEFWQELVQREDLQLLFKQVKPLSPNSIKKIIRVIKAIEDEEAMED